MDDTQRIEKLETAFRALIDELEEGCVLARGKSLDSHVRDHCLPADAEDFPLRVLRGLVRARAVLDGAYVYLPPVQREPADA